MTIYKKAKPATGTGVVKGLLNANNPDKENPFLTKKDLITVRPYKVYTATLTQSGTNDPIANVLENTLGEDLVWVRDAVGGYKASAPNVLTPGKSTSIIQTSNSSATFTNNYPTIAVSLVNNGICYIVVTDTQNFVNIDSGLYESFIEIRVYE